MVDDNQSGWNRALPAEFMLGSRHTQDGPCKSPCQAWILKRSAGNPPALSLWVDLDQDGACWRIFPHFREGSRQISNPETFPIPPRLSGFSSNWIELFCSPLEGITALITCWIPDPEAICGEVLLLNPSGEERLISVGINSQLISKKQLSAMIPADYGGRKILAGRTDHLHLLTFSAGSPVLLESAIPCLRSDFRLGPDRSETLSWTAVASTSKDRALARLDALLPVNRQAEISRRKIAAQKRLRISTGDPDRDFLLALSQIQAERIFAEICRREQHQTTAEASLSPLEGIILLEALAPLEADGISRLTELVLPSRSSTIPPAGERGEGSPHLPLAAEFIWRLQQVQDQSPRLGELLDRAEGWLQSWYSAGAEREDNPAPALNDHGLLDLIGPVPGQEESALEPADMRHCLESPGLSAMLLNEISRLGELRAMLGQKPEIDPGGTKQQHLADQIQSSWIQERSAFLPRGRESRQAGAGRILLADPAPGLNIFRVTLEPPSRIGLVCSPSQIPDGRPPPALTVHGWDRNGNYRIERLMPPDQPWLEGSLGALSRTIFSRLEQLYYSGTGDQPAVITSPNTGGENISCLLPLWCQGLDPHLVQELVEQKISHPDHYLSEYGLRSIPGPGNGAVQLAWNLLVIEGLLRNQRGELAGELLTRLIDAALINVNRSGRFFSAFNARTGRGLGKGTGPGGLIPIGIFLKTAGIQLSNRGDLAVSGKNPFPGRLRIHYRGTDIFSSGEETVISVPGEPEIAFRGAGSCRLIPS